jgi:hypothetical protein
MTPRFPLKRTTSSDTVETVDTVDTIDMDTTFVDRVRSKVKKALGARPNSNDCDFQKEKRVGISLSSLIRRASDHGVKPIRCEQSIFSEETEDPFKQLDVAESEHKVRSSKIDRNTWHGEVDDDVESDEEEENNKSFADDGEESSFSSDQYTKEKPEVVLKRRVHSRTTFDSEYKQRENERRNARETAAILIREKNMKRLQCSKSFESIHKPQRRHSISSSRQHRRGRIVYDVVYSNSNHDA